MWEMLNAKKAPIGTHEGKPFSSARNLVEYDCRRSRHRILAASAYEGHAGKGALIGSEVFTPALAWQSIGPVSGYQRLFLKIACANKWFGGAFADSGQARRQGAAAAARDPLSHTGPCWTSGAAQKSAVSPTRPIGNSTRCNSLGAG
jgi:hypothetical protein